MLLTEDIIKENPSLAIYRAASFDARQDIMVTEVPKLGKEAALKAIKEWGQPISRITHLVFCTSSGINMPGADFQLVKLLGLSHSVQRYMIYQQGCNGGGTALRLAKDLAENNAGNRVLIVCSELSALLTFHAPSETHLDVLVGSAIFADGAAAAVVGADPDTTHERPLFQIAAAIQTLIPDSEDNVIAKTREMGVEYYLSKNTPKTVAKNTEQALLAMLKQCSTSPIRTNDWNELFYVIHPGGPAVLRGVEESLRLEGDKLKTSWNVLSEYGNMWSSTVLFVLDEMRKKSMEEGKATTGDGLEWGVLLGFGPGLTLETVLLRSYAVESAN